MKKIMIIVSAVGLLYACKGKKEAPAGDAHETTNRPAAAADDDSVQIRKVVTGFYNWYGNNYKKLMDFSLYSGIKKKDHPPYKINWEIVEKYQAFIRDSVPQLGQAFLASQKEMLRQCDSAFKVDTEDEIPYGFDYDWYTNSQEDTKYYVDEVNKPHHWDLTINGDNATVGVKGDYTINENGKEKNAEAVILKLQMKKENGKWTIARIGNE